MVCLLLALAFSLQATPETPTPVVAPRELAEIVADDWEFRLAVDPLLATRVGRREGLDQLPAVTPESRTAMEAHTKALIEELDTLDPTLLNATDRATFEILEMLLKDRLQEIEFETWQLPFNSDSGFHTTIARLPDSVPLESKQDYEDYIARLGQVPAYFNQQIANLRAGMENEPKRTLPKIILTDFDERIRKAYLASLPATGSSTDASGETADPEATPSFRPERTVFWAPLQNFPSGFSLELQAALRRDALPAVQEASKAFEDLADFFEQEYIPGARDSIAATDLPNGTEYYSYLVRHFTTKNLSPEEVHELGLAEVAKIRQQMDAIREKEAPGSTFAEYLEELRTDPKHYAKTPEELLRRAALICKRMEVQLPAFFGRLPRQPYGVEPVPDSIAEGYTGGRYVSAPLDSRRGGIYWVNTSLLNSRPLYTLEALSLHEAVPGHHLQHALAAELTDLPEFRRQLYHSAFGEGWALYCELLGKEAGFYQEPVDEFGRLTYEMWRACRLVVDTGMHAMGWSRERALEYLASHTALSLEEVRTEIDRYISWPGQALSYKIGELEILELRAMAEEAQGSDFDLRAFHDAILAQGSVPLPTLRRIIREQFGTTR